MWAVTTVTWGGSTARFRLSYGFQAYASSVHFLQQLKFREGILSFVIPGLFYVRELFCIVYYWITCFRGHVKEKCHFFLSELVSPAK
jgi:hypothetical protein